MSVEAMGDVLEIAGSEGSLCCAEGVRCVPVLDEDVVVVISLEDESVCHVASGSRDRSSVDSVGVVEVENRGIDSYASKDHSITVPYCECS